MTKEVRLTNTRFSGSEKRVFERHPVAINAVLTSAGRGEFRRQIRDFCMGGMLLVDEEHPAESGTGNITRLTVNEVIQIRCAIPGVDIPAGKPCLFEARIVRVDAACTGVAFVNPDLSALHSLMDYVKSTKQPPHGKGCTRPAVIDGRAEGEYTKLAQQCCRMVTASFEPIVATSIETIVNRLFESSKTTKDIVEQNSFFEALEVINKLKAKLIKKFVSSALTQLAGNSLVLDTSPLEEATVISSGDLSLVEEETLDNWLADTGTIEAVERAHREVLDALCKRLSIIFGIDVGRKNNPFGPALFSHSFQDAIQDIGLRHNVNLFAYKVFKDVLIGELGSLYTKMNELLVKNGVSPEIKYSQSLERLRSEMPVDSTRTDDSRSEIEPAAETSDPVEETPDNSHGGSHVNSAGRQAAGDVAASDPVAGNTPCGEVPPPCPETGQDIYALVDELRQLRESLGTTIQHMHRGTTVQETGTKGVNTCLAESFASEAVGAGGGKTQAEKALFTEQEVLQALANIEQNIARLDRSEIRKSIASALVDSSGGTPKEVGGREERIINVSTSIFDTMLSDMQVPVNMREWLARLEMPVLKMAIHDDSIYKDSDHLVRQVVNKIARLGMLVGQEETEGQTGIRNALDWLINLINTDFDGSNDVFKRVSDQLDMLVKAQDKKYKENISKVIQYIEAHKDNLLVDEKLSEPGRQDDEDALEEWMRRVSRLRENDWILFDAKTDNPVRLRVAWVAEYAGKIVFVDAEGKKARVLDIDNFAHSLSLGNAQTIDGANAPTMDRAQYTTLQKLNRDLIYQSTHDQLTALINRREFEKRLATALAESRGAGVQHALCFLDIDQFKIINSSLSNKAGDSLLVQITASINAYLDELEKATFARLGGDEFGIIFHECSLEEALAHAEELIQHIYQHKFEWQGQHMSVSVSLGLAQVTEHSEDISSLIQAAESSSDIAKQMGGNRLQLFYAGNAKLTQRKGIISWVTKIDDILDTDGLQLRCQKIRPIKTVPGKIEQDHYEILLGLKPGQDGSPSIQEFIEAAEYSHRIGHIDRWVVKAVFKWISENDQVLDIINSFSINLSGISLSDEKFIDFILEQIEESNIPAECLCFEVTETAGIENLSDTVHFINTIKETGCRFSLDDFGSGMSSYAYLRDLPVDYLKIDGMFIKNIHASERDYAVVKSITEVAHFMGKRVIAEYVENDEIIEVLNKIGVDFAQGFGIEKPHLIEELV